MHAQATTQIVVDENKRDGGEQSVNQSAASELDNIPLLWQWHLLQELHIAAPQLEENGPTPLTGARSPCQ